MLALETLSRAEQLRMMEALWDDLTREASFPVSDWHGEVLKATENAVAGGEASFLDWDEAKRQLRGGVR
jgi:hypothetical protein